MAGAGNCLLVVAGEASGDLHGARLLAELRHLAPDVAPFGLGGEELRAAGLEAIADSSEVAVVGITEVLRVLPRIRQVFAALLAEVDRRRPRAALLIDFPDFNLRLARQLKHRGVPVVYYISPQVWAWRRGRVKTIARRVDRMLVLFPFEVDFYKRAGVPAVHVGHPLVDEVPQLPSAWDRGSLARPAEAGPPPRRALDARPIPVLDHRPGGEAAGRPVGPMGEPPPWRLALLPGSRASEVESLLPEMLRAVRLLAERLPVAASIIRARTIPAERLEEAIAEAGVPVEIVSEDRFAAIAGCHLAFCASGTATLEVGLLGTPMIVVYRLASWTYLLARLLVRLPYFSLVNLVLGQRVVPELLQEEAAAPRLAREAQHLLEDGAALQTMRSELARLRGRLGEGGASARAAREVADFLVANHVDQVDGGAAA